MSTRNTSHWLGKHWTNSAHATHTFIRWPIEPNPRRVGGVWNHRMAWKFQMFLPAVRGRRSRSLCTECSGLLREVKSLRGAGGLSALMGTQPLSPETAPNTWPSHNSQWESRFTREGERLWHRLCPMTRLQGSGSPQCVDSVTARVEPWRIGCASLPIVLTPVNCGAGYQRAFSAWISHP